jgi:hypothetical protein
VTGFDGKYRDDGVYRVRFSCSSIGPLIAGNGYAPDTALVGTTAYAGVDRGTVFAYDCPDRAVLVNIGGRADVGNGHPTRMSLGCAPLGLAVRQ